MEEVLIATLHVLCIVHVQSHGFYHNVWTVHVNGGSSEADRIAEKYRFTNNGQIGDLEKHYIFTHDEVDIWSHDPSDNITEQLEGESQVLWAEQQLARTRIKRNETNFVRNGTLQPVFNDQVWPLQWYLHDNENGLDMNVAEAWRRGFSGKGVVITILDDGIEYTHDDLKDNYDEAASWDVNGNDSDPMPRAESRHGTRCAGEVAATANNSKCIVGVAFDANIGGVRMLDGAVTDQVEATSLMLNSQHIDIYSSSWGPTDDGSVVEGPGNLGIKALIQGVQKGRHGRGSIFVWASGNGGGYRDTCACDGYSGSIFTITVSSATERGTAPYYLEECSSILTTTLSSGDKKRDDRDVVTTTTQNGCATDHTGTSASAPLAAGIIALALQANTNLTWRDVQHIIVMTSRWRPFIDGNWITNGAGLKVSNKYGFGLMDASAMVTLALNWTSVPEHHTCIHRVRVNRRKSKPIRHYKVKSTGCSNSKRGCPVLFMEHVQLKIQLAYQIRGDVLIRVRSPQGTWSTLLPRRPRDHSFYKYFRSPFGVFWKWPLMSTHFWGEDPRGIWTITIFKADAVGEIQLIIHGTSRHPAKPIDDPGLGEASCRNIDLVDLYTFSMFKRAPFRYIKDTYSIHSSWKSNVSVKSDESQSENDNDEEDLSLVIPLVLIAILKSILLAIGIYRRCRKGVCKNRAGHSELQDEEATFRAFDQRAKPLRDIVEHVDDKDEEETRFLSPQG